MKEERKRKTQWCALISKVMTEGNSFVCVCVCDSLNGRVRCEDRQTFMASLWNYHRRTNLLAIFKTVIWRRVRKSIRKIIRGWTSFQFGKWLMNQSFGWREMITANPIEYSGGWVRKVHHNVTCTTVSFVLWSIQGFFVQYTSASCEVPRMMRWKHCPSRWTYINNGCQWNP